MSKLKAALLICFALCIVTVKISALKVTNQWQDSYPIKQRAVQVKDKVVIFSLVSNSLVVNSYSTDGKNHSQICNVSLPSGDQLYFQPQRGRIMHKEFVLGNGKIVLFANAYLPNAQFISFKREKVFITFDPLDCSSVKTFKIDYEHIPCSLPEVKNDDNFCQFLLIPYHDYFDLFYAYWTKEQVNNTKIVSLRYDDRGNRLEKNVSLSLENRDFDYPIYLGYLQTVKPFDSSEGYFCFLLISKNETKIKFLHFTSQFKLVKVIDAVPDDLDNYTPIISNGLMTLCNSEISNQTCEILDLHLNVKHRVVLKPGSGSIKRSEQAGESSPVINWPDGGFVIVYSIMNGDNNDIYLKDVSLDGSAKVTKLSTTYPRSYYDEVFMFDNGILCVILKYTNFKNKENPYKSSIHCLQKSLQE